MSEQTKLSVEEAAIPNAGIQGINGKTYPIANLKKENGLKRDIIDLVLNLAAPDDTCMLSDFLHALQYVLNKHTHATNDANLVPLDKVIEILNEWHGAEINANIITQIKNLTK